MTRRFAAGDAAAGPDDPDVAPRARDSQLHGRSSSAMRNSCDGGRQATIDEWAAPATSGRGDPPAAVDAEPGTDDDGDAATEPDTVAEALGVEEYRRLIGDLELIVGELEARAYGEPRVLASDRDVLKRKTRELMVADRAEALAEDLGGWLGAWRPEGDALRGFE